MGRASRRRRERRLGGIAAPPRPASTALLTRPPVSRFGTGKISKALLDIVKPFMEEEFTLEQVQCMVQLGAIVWNLSLLDQALQNAEKDRIVLELAPECPGEVLARIDQMLLCKARLHPDDRRCIVTTDVVENGDGYSVFAAGAAAAG